MDYFNFGSKGLESFFIQISNINVLTGPSIDFKLRRTKLASEDLYKEACKIPKELKPIKKKNISRDAFGSKMGRIHIGKQQIGRLQTRKMKGLKKTPEEKKKMLRQKKITKKAGRVQNVAAQ